MEYPYLVASTTIIFFIITVFTIMGFVKKKKYSLAIESFLAYILYVGFLLSEYILNIHVKSYIILLVVLATIEHICIGQYYNFFNTSKHYDRWLHAFGTFSFSLFNYSIIERFLITTHYSRIYDALFIATLGISLGVFFEIAEFIQDEFMKTNNQRGLKDTNWDLLADIIGASLAGIFSIFVSF